MSLFRREIEGVCADLLGPFRARKVRAQSRCAASRPWAEGEAKPPPARLRSTPYIRSSPSRRRRRMKAARPAHSGRPPRLARQAGFARLRWRKPDGQCRRRCHVLDGAPEHGAHQARVHDRHGRWLRPTRIERRSTGSPPQSSATVCRSKSCAAITIRFERKEQRFKLR